MIIRIGHIANSSTTSFQILNLTKKDLTLVDFIVDFYYLFEYYLINCMDNNNTEAIDWITVEGPNTDDPEIAEKGYRDAKVEDFLLEELQRIAAMPDFEFTFPAGDMVKIEFGNNGKYSNAGVIGYLLESELKVRLKTKRFKIISVIDCH